VTARALHPVNRGARETSRSFSGGSPAGAGPASRPDRYLKALDAGADIVCIDMEDAVARSRKDEAAN